MTWLQPASLSMGAPMSPVCAPNRSAWQSWPPMAMPLPASASATARSKVAGGHTRRSQPSRSRCTRCARSAASASPSAPSPFIFQFPAISLRNRAADTTIATVGSRKIDQRQLVQAINEDSEQLRGMFGGARPDPEQLKQLGLVDNALQRLINRDLVDLEVSHLGLALSDGAVSQAIRSNRAFQDEKGQFDSNRYQAVLAQQHMTVPQFESLLRGDLIRLHLSHALVAGTAPPPELVDTLYRSRAEHRVAEVATVPPSAAGDPGTPGDEELAAFYGQHKEAFRVTELRSFTVGQLLLDDVAAAIDVPEDKLRDEYQARVAEFHTPEQRHLQQILLADEAFAAKRGVPTHPIQDELGWHILLATEIKPEVTQPFEAVKDKLKTEVAREMAGDQIAKAANQV